MKILVIGSGGREHALAWKLAQSVKIQKIYVAPGNGGTALDSRLENVNISNPDELAEFAIQNDVQLTVVGPEAPLAAGIVNIFRAKNLKIFGPTKEAAQLESSKDFAKSFMEFQPRNTRHSPIWLLHTSTSMNRVPLSSSRQTALPQARGSSSP